MQSVIIGITGTLGAGKGTIVDYLVKTRGFTHYSARDVWNEEIVRREMPLGRDSMVIVANDMRATYGADYFARTALERAKAAGGNAVIESIRTPGEAQAIKQGGGVIWAVDADLRTRYERVTTQRMSETDAVSFEKFVEDEQKEMTNTDPNKQNIKEVMDMADHIFTNDGAPDELYAQVENVLQGK